MSDKEIDVRVTATTDGLKKGMDEAAGVVSDKSNLINNILKKNAEEAAAIARKQAKEAEDIAKRQMESVANAHKEGAEKMADVARSVQNTIIGIFSISAIKNFVMSTKDAVVEAEASFRGLESVANFSGVGIGKAMEEAAKLASDGLMTTAEASKALQNLLSRGYSLDQAITTLNRLKDAAAYNRAAHLSMGEAVVTATEGLKNENSVLVDNAGVTKNVSKMWEEYAATIGKSANQLTQAEKIQAEYNGVMAETEAQVGNAAKASEGLQGKSAKLSSTFLNLKVSIGEALTPAFEMLAEIATWVMGKFDTFIRLIQISGAQIGKWGADVGAVFNAVSNWDFSNLRSQLASNAEVLRDTVDDIMTAKPGSSFQASCDSGKRRDPNSLNTGGGSGKTEKSKKEQGPVDVFENGSFITSDKSTVDFIKKQFDAVNSLQSEMVREADKAAKDMVQAQKRSAEQRAQVEILWSQNAAAAQMAVVDSAAQAARQQYELGLITYQELLAQEEQFEQQRHQIRLQALNDRLAMTDPDRDPVAYAQILIAIEELERQHQLTMTEIKNAGELERNQYALGAINSVQSGIARSLQQMMMGQMSLAQGLKSIWSSVLSSVTAEIAKFAAAWIAKKLMMLVFGKTAAASEISTAVGKAGANGVASWAAAPWPINMAAPAFGAAMAAAAGAFAPAASAAGGYDIPAGANPITQLHAREMVLPAKHADVIRSLADGGAGADGGGSFSPVINISAMDASGVRDFLMTNQAALVDALRNAHRNGMR